jgi:hypothetical protein
MGCSQDWLFSWSKTVFRLADYRFHFDHLVFCHIPTCLKFVLYMNVILLFIFSGTLKIWKQKLVQMGAEIEERLSKRVTHVFAMNSDAILKQVGTERLARFKGVSFPFYLSLYYALLILHHGLQLSCCIV